MSLVAGMGVDLRPNLTRNPCANIPFIETIKSQDTPTGGGKRGSHGCHRELAHLPALAQDRYGNSLQGCRDESRLRYAA